MGPVFSGEPCFIRSAHRRKGGWNMWDWRPVQCIACSRSIDADVVRFCRKSERFCLATIAKDWLQTTSMEMCANKQMFAESKWMRKYRQRVTWSDDEAESEFHSTRKSTIWCYIAPDSCSWGFNITCIFHSSHTLPCISHTQMMLMIAGCIQIINLDRGAISLINRQQDWMRRWILIGVWFRQSLRFSISTFWLLIMMIRGKQPRESKLKHQDLSRHCSWGAVWDFCVMEPHSQPGWIKGIVTTL